MSKSDIRQRVGDMSQIAGARLVTYEEGHARGMRVVEVDNGTGLRFTVLVDRGMDLGTASWRGTAFSYISKTGLCAPRNLPGWEIKRGWEGGLLYTCGLTNIGPAITDDGELLAMHGSYNNNAASDLCVRNDWDGDVYRMSVSGRVTESRLFGECLTVERTISTAYGSNVIELHDEVVNDGYDRTPFMILYHMNYGWPLLDADAIFSTNTGNKRPRDAAAVPGLDENERFSDPIPGYAEQVFYFDSPENAWAMIRNERLGFGVRIRYDGRQLPHLMEWKMMGQEEYVLGIEPGTQFPEGRIVARERGLLEYLEPGEKRCFDLRISIEE